MIGRRLLRSSRSGDTGNEGWFKLRSTDHNSVRPIWQLFVLSSFTLHCLLGKDTHGSYSYGETHTFIHTHTHTMPTHIHLLVLPKSVYYIYIKKEMKENTPTLIPPAVLHNKEAPVPPQIPFFGFFSSTHPQHFSISLVLILSFAPLTQITLSLSRSLFLSLSLSLSFSLSLIEFRLSLEGKERRKT